MEEGTIRLGSNSGIGTVRLDPAEIRGEGGWHDPRLVIPITIDLDEQSLEHQIVMLRLGASLHLDQHASPHQQFGPTIGYDLTIGGRPVRSLKKGPSHDVLELRFSLTHEQLKALEQMRHEPNKILYLHLAPVLAWNKHTGNSHDPFDSQRSTLGEDGWSPQVGFFSYLVFFWQPTIETLHLELSKMNWAAQIFPGLGYDRFRLIEIALPSPSRLVPDDALTIFENARKDYDLANYTGCVEKCRFVIEALERHLSVPAHEHTLGTAVA